MFLSVKVSNKLLTSNNWIGWTIVTPARPERNIHTDEITPHLDVRHAYKLCDLPHGDAVLIHTLFHGTALLVPRTPDQFPRIQGASAGTERTGIICHRKIVP